MSYYSKFPSLLVHSSLHPYTQAWLAAFTTPATSGLALACDNFVKALVDGSVWDEIDIMAGMPMLDSQQSLINVVNPGVDDFSAVGSPTFTAKQGWKWVTSGARYLISSSNMSALTKYQRDDAHIGCYTYTNVAGGSQVDVGTPSDSNTVINPRNASNLWQGRVNMVGLYTGSGTYTSSVGHHVMRRTSSTVIRGYKDGVSLSDGSSASSAVAATPFGLLAGPSAQSTRECGIGHCGASLTDAQVLSLYNAITTLISEVGAL